MEHFVWVLVMHVGSTTTPVDTVLSAWGAHEKCLIAAGAMAEDDRKKGTLAFHATYECRQVTYTPSS
jgi:hypothetical protein